MAVVLQAAQRDLVWRFSNESKIRSTAGRRKAVAFTQDDLSLRLTGLSAAAPDQPATVSLSSATESRSWTVTTLERIARASRPE